MGTKTKAEVVGEHQERFVLDRIVRGGSTIPSSREASHKKCRPHLKVGKDAEEEVFYNLSMFSLLWLTDRFQHQAVDYNDCVRTMDGILFQMMVDHVTLLIRRLCMYAYFLG